MAKAWAKGIIKKGVKGGFFGDGECPREKKNGREKQSGAAQRHVGGIGIWSVKEII